MLTADADSVAFWQAPRAVVLAAIAAAAAAVLTMSASYATGKTTAYAPAAVLLAA